MIRIHELMYADDALKEKIDEVQEALDNNKILPSVYYITLASNKVEQLDIISGWMFRIEERNEDEIVVVGVAKSKRSAIELVKKMAEDSYRTLGNCNLRKMFS